jgi:hypothetical protein
MMVRAGKKMGHWKRPGGYKRAPKFVNFKTWPFTPKTGIRVDPNQHQVRLRAT